MVRHTLKILQQMHLRVNIFLFWAVSVKFLKKRVLTYKKKRLLLFVSFLNPLIHTIFSNIALN